MAGIITGFYGFQRSGKTALAILLSRLLNDEYDIPVYTNMNSPKGFITIESLEDIPYNFKPKVLLLDEAMQFLDSRAWSDNQKSSFFFNIIGKLNIFLMLTSPIMDMIDIRLRKQHNYMFIAKSDDKNIYYRCFDVQRNTQKDIILEKNKKLFDYLDYDHQEVPDVIDLDIEQYVDKVRAYAKKMKNNNLIKNERNVLKL
ncbi:ATP-binding protein [Sporosalibacterium faouarense]|uniref:ATP-binding protein n=1 Tax=Sporosalibacterium faouarense TaxID=516123 RepID=UPI00192A8308|nr:ATP-binding protein [Sporosalibacterium faouarense]